MEWWNVLPVDDAHSYSTWVAIDKCCNHVLPLVEIEGVGTRRRLEAERMLTTPTSSCKAGPATQIETCQLFAVVILIAAPSKSRPG